MLLEIRHLTQYRYAAPVRESVMELWLQPLASPRQRLLSFDIELDPVAQLFSYSDSFGNAVYHFDCPQPHDQLLIRSRAVVETEVEEPTPNALDRGEWERLNSAFVKGECFDFLRPHGFAQATPALGRFMQSRGLDELKRADPLTAVRRLCAAIYEAFEYEQGVTRADSPIDDTLEAGRGVCQDFAHVMLAICRLWGIPARYVSGYLLTDRSEGHDRSDPDASHAWVEVFLPSLRWVGFDPTNNIPAGDRHVIVAVGRDYGDVPPSRGVFKGDAESDLAVGVSVRLTKTAIAEPKFLRAGRSAMGGATRRRYASAAMDQQLQQQQQQQ